MMDMSEQLLMSELNKIRIKRKYKEQDASARIVRDLPESPTVLAEKQTESDPFNSIEQEKDLIRILLSYGNEIITFKEILENNREIEQQVVVAEWIINELHEDEIAFTDPVYQNIFSEYQSQFNKGSGVDIKYFTHHADQKLASTTIDILTSPHALSDNWEKIAGILVTHESEKLMNTVSSALLSLKSKKLELKISQKENSLKGGISDESRMILQQEILALINLSKEINAQLGRIIKN